MTDERTVDEVAKQDTSEHVEIGTENNGNRAILGRTEPNETLNQNEIWWRDRFSLFEQHGYRLRPRFRPGWVPSWKTNGKDPDDCEDVIKLGRKQIMYAARISDNSVVAIKRVLASSEEVAISRMLSTPERLKDERNHAVPILDYFVDEEDRQQAFMVMPLLRSFDDPFFTTVGEVLDFVHQALEGINYLHNLNVAHRDCYDKNIMMDASELFPNGFHPNLPEKTPDNSQTVKPLRRRDLKTPVRYYFIDFGISTWFRDDDEGSPGESVSQARLRKKRLVTGKHGLLDTVPELRGNNPYDPFLVDIYILGTLLRKTFVIKYSNLHFLAPLTSRMSHPMAKERPSAKEALEQFEKIAEKQRQSPMACRWRLKERKEKRIPGLIADVQAALQEVKYQIGHIPSLFLAPLRREKSE